MIVDETTYLEHYGVKGMKWGVRNNRAGGSKRTDREARKDAEEFARAKMFYGQGAGTRRKLIKNTVEAKAKRDPEYKKAFDKHLADQDLSKHASAARKERSRTDRKETTKKRAGYLARKLTGEMGTQAAFTAAAVAAVAYLNSDRGRRAMKSGTKLLRNGVNEAKRKKGAATINRLLTTLGS